LRSIETFGGRRELLTLLSNHDYKGSESCSSNTGNSEELNEAGDVVALANNFLLDFELAVNVIEVTCGLKWVVAQSQERFICLWVFVLLWF
jgi:hypothetical protein